MRKASKILDAAKISEGSISANASTMLEYAAVLISEVANIDKNLVDDMTQSEFKLAQEYLQSF